MPSPPPIVVFAALEWECSTVLRGLDGVRRAPAEGVARWSGAAGGRPVWVVRTGVGVERAAAATAAAPADAALVVSTGCAGGLDPTLRPGDLVVASAIIDPAGDTLPADPQHAATALRQAQEAGLRAGSGAVRCSASVLADVAAKRAAAAGGAVAVEMEGAPIARWAASSGLPFVSVRAVLDGAGEALDIPAGCVDAATGRVRPLALAAHLATHPRQLSRLVALHRMQQAARTALERFFAAWLGGGTCDLLQRRGR